MNPDRNKRKAIIITAAVHILLLAALFVLGLTITKAPMLEGMAVAFGTDQDGFGSPAYNEIVPELPNQSVTASTPQPVEENLLAMEEESEIVIPETQPKEKKKSPETPIEKTETAPAEKPQEAPRPSDATLSALASILNAQNDDSKGNGQATGYKGSPEGTPESDKYGAGGSSGDGNYNLGNRKPLTKPTPVYGKSTDEGYVVVKIKVDRQGNVISATAGAPGTQITDPQLYRSAEEAARKTKWQSSVSSEPEQEGTIRYYFRIK